MNLKRIKAIDERKESGTDSRVCVRKIPKAVLGVFLPSNFAAEVKEIFDRIDFLEDWNSISGSLYQDIRDLKPRYIVSVDGQRTPANSPILRRHQTPIDLTNESDNAQRDSVRRRPFAEFYNDGGQDAQTRATKARCTLAGGMVKREAAGCRGGFETPQRPRAALLTTPTRPASKRLSEILLMKFAAHKNDENDQIQQDLLFEL